MNANRLNPNFMPGPGESKPRLSVYDLIREEVETTFGRKVKTARDCTQLSDEIYDRTSVTINYNTLRRFFGIVRSNYQPSAATLTILANYCGFASAEDLASYKVKVSRRLTDDEQSMVRFLSGMFKKTPTRDIHDETFLAVVRQAIDYVNDHPAIADKLQRAIAKTKNGQDFYFEQFVNIDKLNGHYGTGLLYYAAEKLTPEAQIFAHALLCQRGWLSGRPEEVKKHAETVMAIEVKPGMHPSVQGRHFATFLFWADTMELPAAEILASARTFHANLLPSAGNGVPFPLFEYPLVIALMLTKQYKEALYYLDYAFATYTVANPAIDKGLYQNLQMCQAICLAATGDKEAAGRIFDELRPSEFYFLTRRTNSILYLLLARELGRPIKDVAEQLEELVQETGFVRLKEMFDPRDPVKSSESRLTSILLLGLGLASNLVREVCMELERHLIV